MAGASSRRGLVDPHAAMRTCQPGPALLLAAAVWPNPTETGMQAPFDAHTHTGAYVPLMTVRSAATPMQPYACVCVKHSPPPSSPLSPPATLTPHTHRFDARSEFSSVLGGAQSDQIAKLEELSLMIRDLAPAPPAKAPWIPEPALAFAQAGLTFRPVPAHTGG